MTCYEATNPDFANLENPNPANHCVAEKITAGNSLIGTTIGSISMFLYYTGSPAGTQFRLGVWDSSTVMRAQSNAIDVSELGTDTSGLKYTADLTSTVTLAENDMIGIMTLSAPSGYGIKIRQCDACGTPYANGQRAIFTQGSGSITPSSADINFCVDDVPDSGAQLLPPPVAWI